MQRLPLYEPPPLEEHVEFVYTRTVGATGILKDWLLRAYSWAGDRSPDRPRVTWDDLAHTALDAEVCLKLLTIADEGEALMQPSATAEEELRLRMQFADPDAN